MINIKSAVAKVNSHVGTGLIARVRARKMCRPSQVIVPMKGKKYATPTPMLRRFALIGNVSDP